MDFIDQLKQFSNRIETLKDNIQTEEATKTSLIMPFFSLLGYDVFNPDEFIPEFTADVGIKKGEKVDYAIANSGEPLILIEAKWAHEKLQKHDSQLFRYFGTTKAKFAILTNGIEYRFFTDLEEKNKMDETPFLTIDLLNIKESQVSELKKFCKSNFDIEEILGTASDLKYSNKFKDILAEQLQSPSDDFIKFFLSTAYSGRMTQSAIDKFRPIIKKSLNNYISELMNDKIQSALNPDDSEKISVENLDSTKIEEDKIKENKIITTEEELEAYFIIKNLLKDLVSIDDIYYKDTESYINILYKNNVRYWICRLILEENRKYLIIPDENKKEIKYSLDGIYSLPNFKDELSIVLNRYV